MHHTPSRALAVAAAALLASLPLLAQSNRGDWAMHGSDPGGSGWQKAETKLSPSSATTGFKFLWKIQLGKPDEVGDAFTEPLLASRLINSHGFKDFVYWTSRDTLYAVDSELGHLLWTRKFGAATGSTLPCGRPGLSIAMEPPVVINFNAHRAPGSPPPAPVPAMAAAPSTRRLGAPAGGGGFALKGIYVLTPDGLLHEQVLTTGADFAPPVAFLPHDAAGKASGLTVEGKTIYVATGAPGCRSVANGISAVDLSQATYPVMTYATGKVATLGLAGPAIAPDGSAFLVTGSGAASGSTPSNSVVALDPSTLKPRDWYTPAEGDLHISAVTPVTFTYKGRQYVVAPAGNGAIALLDAASLGGSDHHTPLARSAMFTEAGKEHGWDGFASYVDHAGIAWVYASISAPIVHSDGSAARHGANLSGGIVAFRVDDAGGKPSLTPVWISGDLINPAPPVLANGVLVALAAGNRSSHATLHALDAATGEELFSSGETIPTYTHLSGLSLGDSHVFFADHTGTLYSFGIAIEH